MKRALVAALAGSLLLDVEAKAQPTLPMQVQADLLATTIEASLADGRAQDALEGLEAYRKLGVAMPAPLLFLEARLASITKDTERGRKAIGEYLSREGVQGDRNYTAALALYTELDRQAATKASERAAAAEMLLSQMRQQCVGQAEKATALIAARVAGSVFQDCPFSPEMVLLAGGRFRMGSSERGSNRNSDQLPHRDITLRAFAIGKYKITFDEWDACVSAGGCRAYRPPDKGQRGRAPVSNVSYFDALEFTSWLSSTTGAKYRLLSEAEWEYAARGGTNTTLYSESSYLEGHQIIKSVGLRAPNPFGLHDIYAYPREYVADCYTPNYKNAPTDGSPTIVSPCVVRVSRNENSTVRWVTAQNGRVEILGFRVARELE